MFQRVTSLSEISEGEIIPLEIDGKAIIVYRHDEKIRACQRYCPHQHADLSEGLVSRGYLICSAHGWQFDAETGVHEMSEQTCLATYAVQVVGDEVQVDPTPIRRGAVPHD